MTRAQAAPVSQYDVLNHLAQSVPYEEAIVQIGASIDLNAGDYNGWPIGLLHLGPGCHGQFEVLMPNLAKGAIVVFEDCSADSDAYTYAVGWSARGHLSSPVEARHWSGLGIATYFGGGK